jgi:hypothetical protein
VLTILNAVNQHFVEEGVFPTNTPAAGAAAEEVSAAGADICSDLVPTYVAALPVDPTAGDTTACTGSYDTDYTIALSATDDRITIAAPGSEGGVATISATR